MGTLHGNTFFNRLVDISVCVPTLYNNGLKNRFF
jgi:hypothetical protein